MIARKVKPGVLEIIDIDLTKELESYSLVEISDKDAYLLLTTSKGFKVGTNNMTIINYESGDSTDSMYKAIVEKKKGKENFVDVSKKYSIDDIDIPGTSVLIRDVEKQKISVARRSTTNSKTGSINRLFINNTIRDKFFNDVRDNKKKFNKYELYGKDAKYNAWSQFMNDEYLRIMKVIKDEK